VNARAQDELDREPLASEKVPALAKKSIRNNPGATGV
jgi:hypothetical protein